MKKLIIALLVIQTSFFAQEFQLNSFGEILTSLKNGRSIKAVIEYEKAKLIIDGKEEKSPNAIGGFEIKTFEYFAKGSVKNEKAFISTSESVLIFHPKYNYVINYVKMRIFDDGSVEIIARYLDPKTYEVKMDETFFSEINQNQNNKAVYFYLVK